jgi:hypothetical protein
MWSDPSRKTHSHPATDGTPRKFTRGAEVDLEFVVEKHAEALQMGRRSWTDVAMWSLPA